VITSPSNIYNSVKGMGGTQIILWWTILIFCL
jgi:hypothetical protein